MKTISSLPVLAGTIVFWMCGTLSAAIFNIADGDVAALKSAITAANSNGQDDTINLAANGTYTLTAVDNTSTGANGLPVIRFDASHKLTIAGHGATIRRDPAAATPTFRLVEFSSGAVVSFDTVTLSNGKLSMPMATGGVIYMASASVSILNSTINNSSVDDTAATGNATAGGGGIYILRGSLSLQGSTFYNNSVTASVGSNGAARATGGAIFSSGASVEVVNCTFQGNFARSTTTGGSAFASGGASANSGSDSGPGRTEFFFNTFADNECAAVVNGLTNSSGAAVYTVTGATTTVAGCILSQEDIFATSLANGGGTTNSLGHNLSTDGGGGFLTASGDQINADARLGPLSDNGGPTLTCGLLPGSAAIDKGLCDVPTDQRGVARRFDYPGVDPAPDGNSSDVGAFELDELPQSGPVFTVNTLADKSDGLCGTKDCSLRDALKAANAASGANTIEFAPGLSGTITLTHGELVIFDAVTITGPGARTITVDANLASRVLRIGASNGAVAISGLTLTGGQTFATSADNALGGGIVIDAEVTITLTNCTISGNSALGNLSSSAGHDAFGGGIFNGGFLTLDGCTVSGNSAVGASFRNKPTAGQRSTRAMLGAP